MHNNKMNKALKIGIDGIFLSGQRRGHAQYAFELCRHLDRLLPNAQFFIYSPLPIEISTLSERWTLRNYGKFLSISPVLWLKIFGSFLCYKDNLDVFWTPFSFLPSLPNGVNKVVTVHDFTYKIIPESLPFLHTLALRLFFMKDVLRADTIITNSEGTDKRLYEYTGCQSIIIKPAIREVFKRQKENKITIYLKDYDIFFPYLLNVATWEPRKNIEILIETFINMKRQGLLPLHKLVLVGKKGWQYNRIESLIANEGKNNIVVLGYVPDEKLNALYNGADVFVFPSIYEGFGMPVLEARACGTPIVTTDIPELREAGGKDAIYVKPTEEGIKKGILSALAQTSPVNPAKIQSPSWQDGAMSLAEVFIGP